MASATYIAQAFAPPSMRIVHGGHSLKADVRCFASEAGVLLFAARLYQGQTTNTRTPGGGFAAVLTTRLTHECFWLEPALGVRRVLQPGHSGFRRLAVLIDRGLPDGMPAPAIAPCATRLIFAAPPRQATPAHAPQH